MDPDDLNSFRPISNLSFLSKVVERIAVRQFVRHADENDLLPVRQSVYRRFHSTESARCWLCTITLCMSSTLVMPWR